MKVQFEEREKIIIKGLLLMAKNAAVMEKNSKHKKYANRLVNKFISTNPEMELKRSDLYEVSEILKATCKFYEQTLEVQKNNEEVQPFITSEDYCTIQNTILKIEQYTV